MFEPIQIINKNPSSFSEEEHYWEFQYPTGYTSTKNNFSQPTYNEQCDIGEVYAAILTELCLVVVVAVAYCFISIKGNKYDLNIGKFLTFSKIYFL